MLLAAGLLVSAFFIQAGYLQSARAQQAATQPNAPAQGPAGRNEFISLPPVFQLRDDPEIALVKQAMLARSRELADARFQVPVDVYRQYLIDRGIVRLEAPVPYIAEEGLYKLTLAETGAAEAQAELAAEVSIEVFSPAHCRNLAVLCGRDWTAVQVNGKDASLAFSDGWLRFSPPDAGRYVISAKLKGGGSNQAAFLAKPTSGAGRGTVAILPTTRTMVAFESPKPWDLTANGWTVHGDTGPTKGTVALPMVAQIEMEYRPTVGKSAHPARYELRGDIAWNQDAGAQQVSAALTVNITGDGSDRIDLVLPAAAGRVSVTGPEVRDVQASAGQAAVYLRGKVAGATSLSVSYDLPPGGDQRTWSALGARDGHWTGGTLIVTNSAGSSEIASVSASGLKELALADVPDSAAALSRAPAVMAYAITGREFSAAIEILPLGQFALTQTIADLAHYELFLSRDGAMMVRIRYEIRNRSRQFLRVDLPEGSKVLLAKVNEKSTPVTPLRGADILSASSAGVSPAISPSPKIAERQASPMQQGQPRTDRTSKDSYLVRLERSRTSVLGMTSFPVEIVYACRIGGVGDKGNLNLPLPTIDLSVAYAYGTAYLPEGVEYKEWAGVFKKVQDFTSQTAKGSLDYGYAEAASATVKGPPTERPKPKPTPVPARPGLFGWASGGVAEPAHSLQVGPPQEKYDALRAMNAAATQALGPGRITLYNGQKGYVQTDGGWSYELDGKATNTLARNYYRAGTEAYDRGDFEQAARYLKKVQEIAPQSVEAENASKLNANPQMGLFTSSGKTGTKGTSSFGGGKSSKAMEQEVKKELSNLRNDLTNSQYGLMNQALEAARKGDINTANTALTNARALNEKLQEQGESSTEQYARLNKFEAAFNQVRNEAQQQIAQGEKQMAELEKSGRFDDALEVGKKLRQLAPTAELNKKIDELAMRKELVQQVQDLKQQWDGIAKQSQRTKLSETTGLSSGQIFSKRNSSPGGGAAQLGEYNRAIANARQLLSEGDLRQAESNAKLAKSTLQDQKDSLDPNQLQQLQSQAEELTQTIQARTQAGSWLDKSAVIKSPAYSPLRPIDQGRTKDEKIVEQLAKDEESVAQDEEGVQYEKQAEAMQQETVKARPRTRKTASKLAQDLTPQRQLQARLQTAEDLDSAVKAPKQPNAGHVAEFQPATRPSPNQPAAGIRTFADGLGTLQPGDGDTIITPVPSNGHGREAGGYSLSGRKVDVTVAGVAAGILSESFVLKNANAQSIADLLNQNEKDKKRGGGGGGETAGGGALEATADPGSNSVIVHGDAPSIARAKQMLQSLDAAPAANQRVVIYQLKNAKAQAIADALNRIEEDKKKSGQTPTNGGLTVAADDRTNSVIVSGGDASLGRVNQLVQALDASTGDTVNKFKEEQTRQAAQKATFQDGRQIDESYTAPGAPESSPDVQKAAELDRTLKSLEMQQAAYATDLDALKKKFGPNHSTVQRLQARQEEMRKARVASLMARAKALEEQKHYRDALDVLDQVLQIEPSNAFALGKRDTLQTSDLLRQEGENYRGTTTEWHKQAVDARESEVPWYGYMTFPKDWREMTARREEYSARAASESPDDQRARQGLQSRLPKVDFTNLELKDVFLFLRNATGAGFHVDWASLANAGVLPTTPVNVTLTDVTAEQVLRLVLQDLSGKQPLGFLVGDGTVLVSTQEQVRKAPVVRVYDIRDLVVRVPNFNGPVMNLTAGVNNAANNMAGGESQNEQNQSTRSELVGQITETIKQSIDKDGDSWSANGTVGSISELNGALVVTQTAENQDKIARMLDALRANRGSNVDAPEQQARQSGMSFGNMVVNRQPNFAGPKIDLQSSPQRIPSFAGPVLDMRGLANHSADGMATLKKDSGVSFSGVRNGSAGYSGDDIYVSNGGTLSLGGQFLDDVQVDFLKKATAAGNGAGYSGDDIYTYLGTNYDWKLRQDRRAAQEVAQALENNDYMAVPVSSFNNDAISPEAAAKLGIQFKTGVNGVTYAVIDEAQYRTLMELQAAAGQKAPEARRQLTAVTTDALLANGMTGKVVLARDRSNTIDISGNSLEVAHDSRLLLVNGRSLTIVQTAAVQPFNVGLLGATGPQAVETPLEINVPRVGQVIQFEKTLLEPTDKAVLRAQYTQKGK